MFALCIIYGLVFVAEMESVYCAVRLITYKQIPFVLKIVNGDSLNLLHGVANNSEMCSVCTQR
jgi:hypothetical protein